MPKGKNQTYRFYSKDGTIYPFYAPDKTTAIRWAIRWSRRTGVKLYQQRSKKR